MKTVILGEENNPKIVNLDKITKLLFNEMGRRAALFSDNVEICPNTIEEYLTTYEVKGPHIMRVNKINESSYSNVWGDLWVDVDCKKTLDRIQQKIFCDTNLKLNSRDLHKLYCGLEEIIETFSPIYPWSRKIKKIMLINLKGKIRKFRSNDALVVYENLEAAGFGEM